MKLSTRSRYGMRAVLDLAVAYGSGPVQIKTIAKEENISSKYLEQLISILKSAGLVRSLRGPKGGYVLAKPPSEITLTEVFRVLEGPISPVECIEDENYCDDCPDCVMRKVWSEIHKAVEDVLGSYDLAELAEKAKKKKKSALNYQI